MAAKKFLLAGCTCLAAASAVDLDDTVALLAWKSQVDETSWVTVNSNDEEQGQLEQGKKPKVELKVWGKAMFHELNFVSAIDKAIAYRYEDPRVQRIRSHEAPMRNVTSLKIQWQPEYKEKGTELSLTVPQNDCSTRGDGIKDCLTDFNDQRIAVVVNVALAKPLPSPKSQISFAYNAVAGFVKETNRFTCAACGAPCTGTIEGRRWTMQMPPCPVPAGTLVLQVPIPQAAYIPNVGDFALGIHGEVWREGQESVAKFGVRLVAE